MIRMIQSISANHVKSYFSDSLSKSDYYTSDQESQGVLHGKLAQRIGLDVNLTKDIFYHLCENINPVTGHRLTLRTKNNRTTAYDVNFHAPKSLSILHAFAKDDHLTVAFQSSVSQVMKKIEEDSLTRVRKGKTQEDRPTGELIWAEFLHQTARAVNGLPPDPHLHSHALIFNMTWDKCEKQIKAGQFRNIKRDMPFYQSLFSKILSDNLIHLGYKVKRTSQSFEIEGVPQSIIDLFSKRSNAIGQFAADHNITNKKQLDKLGAITRSKKQKGLSMKELKLLWKEQIKNFDVTLIHDDTTIRNTTQIPNQEISAQDCLNYATAKSFERNSVVPERRFLEDALKHGIGDCGSSSTSILEQAANDQNLIRVRNNNITQLTTQEVLQQEREMIMLAKSSQGKCEPIYSGLPDTDLEGQQLEAVRHVLTTKDRVSIVLGSAGTGKTTIMKTVERLVNRAGKKLIVVAPTAEASKGVLVADGFTEANTVARLLIDSDLKTNLRDQVLWVDEAGLLGSGDMKKLLQLSSEQNCQIILGGDIRQHSSVVRGDALRILHEVGEVKTSEINKIVRQKSNNYRSVVEDLAKAQVKSAFEKLEEMGAIIESDNPCSNDQLAEHYIRILKQGKSALVVSPTHRQGNIVTKVIRDKMREKGMLGKDETYLSKLTSLTLTTAEKSDYRNYTPGLIVQFNQNLKGCNRGSQWKVNSIDRNNVLIVNNKKEEIVLPLDESAKFEVYEKAEIAISKGDKIKITKNGFDLKRNRLNNGQTLEAYAIDKKGCIKFRSVHSKKNYELDTTFGHLAHAHCITSYAAQGKTVDHVLISQPSSTIGATDAKQFYVSVSRGKESVTIYTDDKQLLIEHAAQLGERHSALELIKNNFKQYPATTLIL